MDVTGTDIVWKRENLQLLRRYLGLTQKAFIEKYLIGEDGKPSMSVATLSNLESKGGERLTEVILAVSNGLGIDSVNFFLPTDEFAEKIDMIIPKDKAPRQVEKKGSINENLNRLTMYFAEQMFNHSLKKGDRIEPDRVLAEKLGIGRSAVREALKVLNVLGMIDIQPGRGMFISNNETNFFIIPLSWSLFLSGNQVDSIIEVRHLLEVKAAELAAGSEDREGLNHLNEVTHRMHLSYVNKDYKAFLRDDLEFHITIAQCCGNQVIYSMLQTISNLMKYVSGTGMVEESQLRDIYEEHQKIFGYIIARDAKAAAAAMEEHLEKSNLRYNLEE